MKKLTELFTVIKIRGGEPYLTQGTSEAVDGVRRMCKGLELEFDSVFRVESLGMFTSRTVTLVEANMSQYERDAGGDYEEFDVYHTVYTKV